MIELAYRVAEGAGIALWNQDEAGPYQTIPYPGESWEPAGSPARQPHEYVRNGTAKLLTLFRPVTGEVRGKGVGSAPNAVLHPWLQAELTEILATLPEVRTPEQDRGGGSPMEDLVGPRAQSTVTTPAAHSHLGQSRRTPLVGRSSIGSCGTA